MKTQTFCKQKTASVSLRRRSFYGRGWITQAAHLKKPRRGFFPRRTIRRVDAVRIHPPSLREGYYKTETPVPGSDTGVLGGRGWIRTTEAEKQQIYSLSPLATREHAHILFAVIADCLYILSSEVAFVNYFFHGFSLLKSKALNATNFRPYFCGFYRKANRPSSFLRLQPPSIVRFYQRFSAFVSLMLSDQAPVGIRGTLCRRSYSRKFFWDSC